MQLVYNPTEICNSCRRHPAIKVTIMLRRGFLGAIASVVSAICVGLPTPVGASLKARPIASIRFERSNGWELVHLDADPEDLEKFTDAYFSTLYPTWRQDDSNAAAQMRKLASREAQEGRSAEYVLSCPALRAHADLYKQAVRAGLDAIGAVVFGL